MNQVLDRVNTTATVWLGSTIECAQCHDHPYDPFTQREYYRLLAFFNNTPLEVKHTGATTYDFYGPKLTLPAEDASAGVAADVAKDNANESAKEGENESAEQDATRPTTLVMVEMEQPRETFLFRRGDFLSPTERVAPGMPAVFPPAAASPADRLHLARWLVRRDNPLTARVTVNRWWAEVFGRGLVVTVEDLGTQGDQPSHPRLLDWLAVELMESGWSMKHVLRLMVTSAAYQQTTKTTPELLRRDPHNALLARGPRMRMSAEMLRDNGLAISGLLSQRIGGPPVYPPQPPKIWRHVGRNAPKYETDEDADRFRRGVYVIWRRSAPYPSFVNFDAPDRAACVVQRSRTNTPLQALTLLNDPAFVEMAWGLARRMAGRSQAIGVNRDAVVYGFRLCAGREPLPAEVDHLLVVYHEELTRLREDPSTATALVGKQSPPEGVLPEPLAAWFYVANILLNLDETITKD